jgi:peptidoglycan/LPS O-acetylase OafA/YrhL
LDGLRCISIVGVVWHHSGEGPALAPMLHNGFLGVDLFFVLSGFLIVTLLLRERDARGAISLRNFYVRRSLRIFPLYYGVLLALTLFLLLPRPDADMREHFFDELPFYLTYTSNWIDAVTMMGIAWTLAAEEQFYVAWPPVERFLRRLALPILVAFLLLNQAINFGLLDELLERGLGLRRSALPILQATFTPICLGVALAHLLHRESGFRAAAWLLGRRWSSLVLALLLVAACNFPGDLQGWPRLSIQLVMAGLLGACVVREDHSLQGLLGRRLVRRIGTVSYGVYLLHLFARHGAVLTLTWVGLEVPGLLFVVTLTFSLALAELSFRFYEKPFLRLKTRFARV